MIEIALVIATLLTSIISGVLSMASFAQARAEQMAADSDYSGPTPGFPSMLPPHQDDAKGSSGDDDSRYDDGGFSAAWG